MYQSVFQLASYIVLLKTAYLILTHGSPDQLKRLVNRISTPDDAVFISVDKKTDIAPYEYFRSVPNVHIITKRIKVHWGSYRMIDAVCYGFEEIIATGVAYDYVHLISGQDYPIKSNDHIRGFLQENPGKAFMEFYDIQTEWTEAIPRLEKYFLTNYPFPGSNKVADLLTKILPKRKLPYGMIAVGRSQWFTITLEHVQYIVDYMARSPKLKRFFLFCWGCDEIVFQTILFNSPFKKDMVNNNLRYIDWSEKKASPKTLTLQDGKALTASDKLFARKFNVNTDTAILDYLDKQNRS